MQGSYIGNTTASQAVKAGSTPVPCSNKKASFVYRTKEVFLNDAFLLERDAHCVRDAGFACGARLRRVCGTHRITYHSNAASLITYLQTNTLIKSSPVVSTIHEKSERLHDRKCVRIFLVISKILHIDAEVGGVICPLGLCN